MKPSARGIGSAMGAAGPLDGLGARLLRQPPGSSRGTARWVVLALLAVAPAVGARATDAGESTVAVVRPAPPAVRVVIRDGRLDLQVANQPWARVLSELTRTTGMVLHVRPQPEGSVTASFEDVPVERALRRLFGVEADYVFLYDPPGSRPTSSGIPSEVWVRSGGSGGPGVVTAGTGRPQAAWESGAPSARPTAVRPSTLPRARDVDPPALAEARDRDPNARKRAVFILGTGE